VGALISSALKGQLFSTPRHRRGSSHQQRPERAAFLNPMALPWELSSAAP